MKNSFFLHFFVILIFGFNWVNLQGQQINRGPYLQQGAPTSIIVKWRTDNPENSQVKFGTTAGDLSQSTQDSQVTTEHEVKITGLNPNTKYYYQVGSQSSLYEPRPNQFFKTAPDFGEEKPFRTWILGDPGTRTFRQRQVRDGYLTYSNSVSPDIMLLLGDNAYTDGTDEEYQGSLFENMYENILVNTHLWSSTGNHDIQYGHEDVYYGIFSFPTNGELGGEPSNTESYYSFNYGNVHFVTIESSDEDKSKEGTMAKWLKKDLENNTQDWTIVYFHHPVYSGGHDTDEESGLIELRENFVPIIEQYGADLVLYGHSHRYERTGLIKGHLGLSATWDPATMAIDNGLGQEDNDGVYDKTSSVNGTVYVTTGNAGKGLGDDGAKPVHKFTNGEIGSGVLEINGKRLDYKQLDGDGTVIDYFTILKGDNIPNPNPDSITVSITDGNDDVEENQDGGLNFDSSDLEMVYDHSSLQTVGLRFRSVELPQNATVKSAYIQFTADESNSADAVLEISLHDSPNSSVFSSSNNVSQRTTFSDKVTWNPASWSSNQNSNSQRTPDLKNMVQSLINKSDWTSGNNMSFMIKGKGESLTDINAKRVADSYEGGANKAAQLVVTYSSDPDPDPNPVQYCESKGKRLTYEYISRVQIGTINNVTEASTGGYGDFTSLSTTLEASTTIAITPSWPRGTAYSEGYAVWIDYNKDGDFEDSGELVFTKTPSKDTSVTGTFTIPANAQNGAIRMRVSMKYNSIPSSCESFSDGEVEDYTVVIATSKENLLGKESKTIADENEFDLQIHPNPVKLNGKIRVSISNKKLANSSYTIINLAGQIVDKGSIGNDASILLKTLKAGVYILQIRKANSETAVKQFVIE